jgi:Zn-dependent peptidase ImmA (M78 family)
MSPRSEATRLLQKFWGGQPIPVDPTRIAEKLGVTVRAGRVSELKGASGWYKLDDDEEPLILFNSSEVDVRQRFTIAHELGHHVLGHGPRPRDTTFSDQFDSYEIAANQFAAELLMPVFAVQTLVEKANVTSLARLAGAFQVSELAMNYRLKNLGYV